VHDELHGVAAVRGGQLGAVRLARRRVEQLQQRGLHVDGGDDGGSGQLAPVDRPRLSSSAHSRLGRAAALQGAGNTVDGRPLYPRGYSVPSPARRRA